MNVTSSTTKKRSRTPIPYDVQVRVFFRDRWICHWCHRPVVFSPAFRLLDVFVKEAGYPLPTAYYHPAWNRTSAPLLDHLGAVLDHVEAFAKGGVHGEANLVTSCNKCNTRKNDSGVADFVQKAPAKRVKSRHGEPVHWDGLVSLFLVLAERGAKLESWEQKWALALRKHLGGAPGRPTMQ